MALMRALLVAYLALVLVAVALPDPVVTLSPVLLFMTGLAVHGLAVAAMVAGQVAVFFRLPVVVELVGRLAIVDSLVRRGECWSAFRYLPTRR